MVRRRELRLIEASLLIIGGTLIAVIGGILFSQSGTTATTKYTASCVLNHYYADTGSDHELDLGRFDQQGNCQEDPSQSGIGYKFKTIDLSPSFPLRLSDVNVIAVEVWYEPNLSSGTCGATGSEHDCQIAHVIAVRTFKLTNNGKDLVPDTLYTGSDFHVRGAPTSVTGILSGNDLTQPGYAPKSATYKQGSVPESIGALVAGVLMVVGGVFWLRHLGAANRASIVSQTITSQKVIPGQTGYTQPYQQRPTYPPGYPQQPGYLPQQGKRQWPDQQ